MNRRKLFGFLYLPHTVALRVVDVARIHGDDRLQFVDLAITLRAHHDAVIAIGAIRNKRVELPMHNDDVHRLGLGVGWKIRLVVRLLAVIPTSGKKSKQHQTRDQSLHFTLLHSSVTV